MSKNEAMIKIGGVAAIPLSEAQRRVAAMDWDIGKKAPKVVDSAGEDISDLVAGPLDHAKIWARFNAPVKAQGRASKVLA